MGLADHHGPEAARHLANLNGEGKFRPLKTTRDLRTGWRLIVSDVPDLRRALDYFYPAMIGVRESYSCGELPWVPLRETLERQSGMYRVTAKISDAQARDLIDGFCVHCMKHRLWEIRGANPAPLASAPGEWPLICQEACNLLVAEARKVVKSSTTP
jgi:hypothetical protein